VLRRPGLLVRGEPRRRPVVQQNAWPRGRAIGGASPWG
jgi:hypothetical protein